MGYQGQEPFALVAMTNGDVYYISTQASQSLERAISDKDRLFRSVDVKSGARLKLHVPNVSSIVEEGPKNA